MSDPVTNVEIEDVLSSIRRLVSQGDKPRKAEPAKADAKDVAPEKLVLTPALRVDEPEADPEDTFEDGADFLVLSESQPVAAEAEQPKDVSPSDRANLEATIAELEAAVTEQPDEWEPDGSEYKPNWDRTLFEAVEEAVADAATPQIGAQLASALSRPTHDPVEDAWHSRRSRPTPAEEETSAPDEAPAEDQTAVAADMTEAEALQGMGAAETIEDQVAEIVADPVESAPVYETFDQAEPAVKPAQDDEPELAQENETPSDNDARVAFRHLDREVVTPHDDLVGGAEESASAQIDTLDEDALRALVIDIVRSELNGKLGERITRNVRKLVRREIMRVLNAQDLD